MVICCVICCLDASINLDLVNIPWSVSASRNHGHAWMSSQCLLALAEGPMSYGIRRGSKSVAKACIYFTDTFKIIVKTFGCYCVILSSCASY